MEKRNQIYEGKAKKVFATDDDHFLIVEYKDDATAFNGLKKGTIAGKGIINNKMSNIFMEMLEKQGVPTHFAEQLSDRETLVKKVSIIPLEVIVRNIAAGSFSKRYGTEEGLVFESPVIEFSYKNDDLGDPLINDYHAVALKLITAGGNKGTGVSNPLKTNVFVKVKVAQPCLTLCNPMDYTVHGILQARILEWVAFPFSWGSSQPRDRTQVFHIAGRFFTS